MNFYINYLYTTSVINIDNKTFVYKRLFENYKNKRFPIPGLIPFFNL